MLGTIYKNWIPRKQGRRKEMLEVIRRQFEQSGYSVGDLTDSQLEAAITYDNSRIENSIPLTGKRIYWIFAVSLLTEKNFADEELERLSKR